MRLNTLTMGYPKKTTTKQKSTKPHQDSEHIHEQSATQQLHKLYKQVARSEKKL